MLAYLHLLLLLAFAVVFSSAFLMLSRALGPKRPTPVKEETFECGLPVQGSFIGKFPLKFYLVVILFLLFDLEIVFLYPWAIQQTSIPWGFWLLEGFLFAAILMVGWWYVIRQGALDWSPRPDRPDRSIAPPSSPPAP